MSRFGHRVRWAAAWLLLLVWFVTFMLDVGSGVSGLLLVLGVAFLFYELLAADRSG